MSERKHFDEFFSKKQNRNFDLSSAIENESIFRSDIFCPECKKAQLTLVAKTHRHRAYLRRIPTSHHHRGCSYNYEYANKKTTYDYIKSLNPEELQDKLESIMRLLCKPPLLHQSLSTEAKTTDVDASAMLIPSQNKSNVLKSLKRKKLGTYIDPSENGELYVFYGKVYLKIKSFPQYDSNTNKLYSIYFLEIYARNSNEELKKKASFYLGNSLKEIDEESQYYMVFIGYPSFNRMYPEIKLVSRDAFIYKKVWYIDIDIELKKLSVRQNYLCWYLWCHDTI